MSMNNNSVKQFNKKNFLSTLFLETVCNDLRTEFLQRTGETVIEFKKSIQNDSYDDIIEKLNIISQAEKCLIFQTYEGDELDTSTQYNDIVIIGKTKPVANTKLKYEITRSELLDFYRNHTDNCIPKSSGLLEIKKSLKIVSVEEKQNDLIVGTYERTACKIAYIQLQFNTDEKITQNVYLVLIFKEESKYFDVLSKTKKVLAFRNVIVERFKSDFKENKPALYADTKFRQEWLADKKAGDHMCDKSVDDICEGFFKKAKNMLEYFEKDVTSNNVLNNEKSMILISNTHIARYFRRLVSDRFEKASLRDVVPNDEKIIENVVSLCSESNKFKIDSALKSNNYDIVSTLEECTSIPLAKNKMRKTYIKKYLQCFLIDVLNSMVLHAKHKEIFMPLIKVEEFDAEKNIHYLVFENLTTDLDGTQIARQNYDLKQRIEFEKNASGNRTQGISLGSLANFISDFDLIEHLFSIRAYYDKIRINEKEYTKFVLKLPILTKTNTY